MRLDKEAFNAEVRRRGKERITARKRARKRMLVSCASLAACLLLLIAVLPNFEWWKPSDFAADMSPQDQDSMSGANADQITENDQTGKVTPPPFWDFRKMRRRLLLPPIYQKRRDRHSIRSR